MPVPSDPASSAPIVQQPAAADKRAHGHRIGEDDHSGDGAGKRLVRALTRWFPGQSRRGDMAERVALMPPPAFDELFDPTFLAALAPFALRVASAQKGGRLASQRTNARGQGSDFADFKSYVAGDDLRMIDWNIYRRLGKLFVRVFEERQDLPCYLLLDRSRSMFVERPPRIQAGLRAALALAAVALDQHDNVTIMPFSDDMTVALRGVTGRRGIGRVAQVLATLDAAGGTGLASALRHVGALRHRRGLLIVISDFFDDAGIEAVIDAMRQVPHRLLLVQLTKAHDADPGGNGDLQGDVVLDDAEAADGVPVTVTARNLDRYAEVYRVFNRSLTDFAAKAGIGFVQIDADRDVIEQLGALFSFGRPSPN